MKLKDFLRQFENMDPESEVIMPMHNGEIGTYAVVDKVYSVSYDELSNDFFGTPGPMDSRLFTSEIDKHPVVMISTIFPFKYNL